jgi:hypothetical protein
VAAAFLAHEPLDEARNGRAGVLAMAWQIAFPDGPAVAATQALHANAPERSFALPTCNRSHSYASRNADADLRHIGTAIPFRESAHCGGAFDKSAHHAGRAGTQEALSGAYCWSMIFPENRCPLFGIML